MAEQNFPVELIEKSIYVIRDKKVMLDVDLANLYEVETGNLNRAVKRNIDRFPDDFMFKLTKDEFENLRSQFGISSWGGRRYLPYVFTEQGVAMLSSVLKSKKAILVNVQIMRAFVRLREIAMNYKELDKKIINIEKKYDKQFKNVFDVLRQLMNPKFKKVRKIGFSGKDKQK